MMNRLPFTVYRLPKKLLLLATRYSLLAPLGNLRFLTGLATFYLLFTTCVGCSSLKETTKGFLGISTKILEEGRQEAITELFNYDYFTCYTKTSNILKEIGSYAYAQDLEKHMIAIYVSEQDTTPVGIFFEEIDRENTQVEITSPSKYAKELIAQRLFSKLKE